MDAIAQDTYGGKEQLLADVTRQSSLPDKARKDSLVEALVAHPLPLRQGRPLVEDWDCLRVCFYICLFFSCIKDSLLKAPCLAAEAMRPDFTAYHPFGDFCT